MILARSVSWVHSVDIAFSWAVFCTHTSAWSDRARNLTLSFGYYSRSWVVLTNTIPVFSALISGFDLGTLSSGRPFVNIVCRLEGSSGERVLPRVQEKLCSNVASLIARALGSLVTHLLTVPMHQRKIRAERRDKLWAATNAKYVSELVLDCGRNPSVVFLSFFELSVRSVPVVCPC